MEGGSRVSNSRVGGDGAGVLRDGEDEDGDRFEAEREHFDDHGRQSQTSRPPAVTYRSMISAMLLSLLPLPASAYPRAEPGVMRRDRRRSGDFGKREMTRAVEKSIGDNGFERRRAGKVEREQEVGEGRVQNSHQPLDTASTTVYKRAESATPSTSTISFPIPVPVTALPYKLTQDGGGWTTVDGGWTLYGRTSVDQTTQALADTDPPHSTPFNITAALPSGWGLDSERGALYAVPLIVVASVCMALLFMAFVVLVVISRVKARRKAERGKRRREAREKRERRERRLAARAAAAAVVVTEGNWNQEDGRPTGGSVRSRRSRRHDDQGRERSDSVSTLSDSSDAHDDDADSSRRPSGSGTTSTTVRLAKQRAAAVAAAEAIEAAPRAGRAKKRFGWTSGVNAVGTGRLGDPRRVWGWKRGLRRRGGAGEEREKEVERVGTRDEPVENGIGSPRSEAVERSPVLPTDVEEPHVLGESSSDEPSSGEIPIEERPAGPASAFPPAYYRTTSGTALRSPSAQTSDESPTGRITDVGPSARALEKRPMAGVGYDDCFPAPTTVEQEEAVNIAYNRNSAVGASGETTAEMESAGEYSGAMEPMATGAAGHVATDDKQVLERLRMAGSAPPPRDEIAGVSDESAGPLETEPTRGTAPDLPVDEDGFETLEDLPPPDEQESTSCDGASPGTVLPLPPAPIAQRSLAYAQPSAPPGMSSPVLASAPSGPCEDEPEAAAMPSAPPLELDSPESEADQPEPRAPPLDEGSDEASDPTGSLSRRFTVPHRTLGIDLPSELAAPPAFPHPEDPVSSTNGVGSLNGAVGASRYLPRYEP